MPRHHLMHRREQQVLLTRHEGVLHRLGPARIGRGDVIDRRHVLLERAGGVDIGRVLTVIGRTFLDQRLFGAGDRHQILGDHERAQFRNLPAGRGDGSADRLVRIHLGHALRHRLALGEQRAGGDQRILVALQVGAAGRLQRVERGVHALGRQHHPREPIRSKRKPLGCGRALSGKPLAKVLHRGRRGGGMGRQLLLQGGVVDRRKRLARIAAVVIGIAVERGHAEIDEAERHRRLQIGTDILRRRRHLLQERVQRLHPRRRVGIVARDIDVGIKPGVHIPLRVGVRLVGILQPEQLPFGNPDQIIPLEPRFRRHRACVERLGLRDRPAQEIPLPLQPRRAPVAEPAVEIMPSQIHRRRGIDLEPRLDEGVAEAGPIGRGLGRCRRLCRRAGRRSVRAAAPAQRQGDHRNRQPFRHLRLLPDSRRHRPCWQHGCAHASEREQASGRLVQ